MYKGEESDRKLEELVSHIKVYGKNREYDCLVGISGGVDSSYVAYIVKKTGLRPLVVHFDNGWNTELSIRNIENVVKKLGFEYQTYVVDWEEFRDVQMAYLEASVLDVETPTDHAFLAALYRLSARHGIRYIITGSNFATEAILPKSWGYNSKDLRQLKAIYRRFGKRKLKSFPFLGFLREFYYTYIRRIRLIRILQYVPYSKNEAIKTLHDELGWEYYGGKHYESLFTRFTQAYMLPVKFNVDKRRAHFSTLVCNGEITRDQALAELDKELYNSDQLRIDREFVIRKFGISDEQFTRLMSLPVKTYRDYPNNEKLLGIIYRIYYFITGRN
jgi:N-acetyl sugar amidotransferase